MQAWCAEVLIVRVFITACQSSVCACISSFMKSSLLNTMNTMKVNHECLVTIILHHLKVVRNLISLVVVSLIVTVNFT